MEIKASQSIARFCRFIMKNYLIYFKTEILQKLWISVKINIQEYL